MSTIVSIYIPEGIVMAADSRVVKKDVKPVQVVSDNAQKLFLLDKRVGISFCGDLDYEGRKIDDFLDDFDHSYDYRDKNGKAIIHDFVDYISPIVKDGNIHFQLSAYDEEEYVFVYENKKLKRFNEDGYGAVWSGDTAYLSKLINDKPKLEFDFADFRLKDGIAFCEFLINTNINIQHFSRLEATCGGPIDILCLQKHKSFWYKHKLYTE